MQTQYALPGNAGFAVPRPPERTTFRRPIHRAERIREKGLSDVERQAPGAAFFRRSGRSGGGVADRNRHADLRIGRRPSKKRLVKLALGEDAACIVGRQQRSRR